MTDHVVKVEPRYLTDHELKIEPKYFDAVYNCTKRFEVRKNDRNYKVGDRIRLREWDGTAYTGREIGIEISYILTSEDFPDGIREGYCVLGFLVDWSWTEGI